ncbi:MAG: glucose-6-phosphate isomerase [Chitinophagaceae bacterium]|nr:glucose-6-phosphate isomerase [Chitinophagaceae bacterium]
MLSKTIPIKLEVWEKLKKKAKTLKKTSIVSLFDKDKNRAKEFSIQFEDIFFDFSKNLIDKDTLNHLLELCKECKLQNAKKQMFSGEAINETEQRSVLHTALRNTSHIPIKVDGKNIMDDVNQALDYIKNFSKLFHEGKVKGYTNKPLKSIINIGIGGSDLGPYMVTECLKPYQKAGIKIFFVSNIDGSHLTETLKLVNPEETLFIIASKTFTTQETMTNAASAKKWLLSYCKDESYIKNHFIAVSTNQTKVVEFGISPSNMFTFWDWVGGRYSLWSSIGISIVLSIGFDNFIELLKGAHAMDNHFLHTEDAQNMPTILAVLGIWYNNFFDAETSAVLCYEQNMHRFAQYLQQLDMESNGKNVNRKGKKISYQTGQIIWGEPGTNGQHAFYQHIHQGTKLIPCDFIAFAQAHHDLEEHHEILLSNFFAQSQALMIGKAKKEVHQELALQNKNMEYVLKVHPYKVFDGNKPSNSFLIKKLTPYNLGALIALYEHKIFVQGIIWNIYSFDQWGVELGKELANKILPYLKNDDSVNSQDPSTNILINTYKKMKKK